MFRAFEPGSLRIAAGFESSVRLARLGGFNGLCIHMDALEKLGPDGYLEATRGLRPGAWGLPVDFRKDDAAFSAGLPALKRQAPLAKAIGADRCATWVLPWSDERPFAAQFDLLARRFRECARILGDHGCRLGLEFVGPKTSRDGHKYEFIHTMAGMLELCDAVGTGNTGLLLDAWHWYTSGGTVDEILALPDERLIVHVHVSDAPAGIERDRQVDKTRELPGATGVIDLVGFLKALDHIGYDGPVQVEPFCDRLNGRPPEEVAAVAGKALAGVWKKAGLA